MSAKQCSCGKTFNLMDPFYTSTIGRYNNHPLTMMCPTCNLNSVDEDDARMDRAMERARNDPERIKRQQQTQAAITQIQEQMNSTRLEARAQFEGEGKRNKKKSSCAVM